MALYWDNPDMRKYVNIVPTSAVTGEGLPDMLQLLVKLTQVRALRAAGPSALLRCASQMAERLMCTTELQWHSACCTSASCRAQSVPTPCARAGDDGGAPDVHQRAAVHRAGGQGHRGAGTHHRRGPRERRAARGGHHRAVRPGGRDRDHHPLPADAPPPQGAPVAPNAAHCLCGATSRCTG